MYIKMYVCIHACVQSCDTVVYKYCIVTCPGVIGLVRMTRCQCTRQLLKRESQSDAIERIMDGIGKATGRRKSAKYIVSLNEKADCADGLGQVYGAL